MDRKMELKFASWNIRGLSTTDKQKEIKKLISEERIQLMAVLETHIKYQKIIKVRENIFGNWEYCSNQCMFFLVETVDKKIHFFYIVVYASNSGGDRKKLWYDFKT